MIMNEPAPHRQAPLLIFDCDGTLVDSELLCKLAMEKCLAEIGIVESAASLLARYRGARFAAILDDLTTRHQTSLPAVFTATYRSASVELFEQRLTATPGVIDAIESLQHHPQCVASSAPRAKIEHMLGLTGLLPLFDGHIYSAYEVGSWKPEPGLFLHACATEGYDAQHCIVIEDSLPGVEAAHSAGMPVLLFDPENIYPSVSYPHLTRFSEMRRLPELIRSLMQARHESS